VRFDRFRGKSWALGARTEQWPRAITLQGAPAVLGGELWRWVDGRCSESFAPTEDWADRPAYDVQFDPPIFGPTKSRLGLNRLKVLHGWHGRGEGSTSARVQDARHIQAVKETAFRYSCSHPVDPGPSFERRH